MANPKVMKRLEASDNLDEKVPDLPLSETCISFLMVVDQNEKVAAVGVLHHDAECVLSSLGRRLPCSQ